MSNDMTSTGRAIVCMICKVVDNGHLSVKREINSELYHLASSLASNIVGHALRLTETWVLAAKKSTFSSFINMSS
jgi:hypothetical protein